MSKYMSLIRLIILSLFIFTQTQADTIYNLIKIPNLEIYDIKTTNKLRYLYAKKPFTLGTEKNIKCYDSKKSILDFLINIVSYKLIKAIIPSILCKNLFLPTIFKARFNLAYDLILEKDI